MFLIFNGISWFRFTSIVGASNPKMGNHLFPLNIIYNLQPISSLQYILFGVRITKWSLTLPTHLIPKVLLTKCRRYFYIFSSKHRFLNIICLTRQISKSFRLQATALHERHKIFINSWDNYTKRYHQLPQNEKNDIIYNF